MSTRKTPGGKDGRCVRVTTFPPSQCRKSRKSGALTYRNPLGHLGLSRDTFKCTNQLKALNIKIFVVLFSCHWLDPLACFDSNYIRKCNHPTFWTLTQTQRRCHAILATSNIRSRLTQPGHCSQHFRINVQVNETTKTKRLRTTDWLQLQQTSHYK
jgi:hypothetical protein